MPPAQKESKKVLNALAWRQVFLLLCLAAGVLGWLYFSRDEAKIIRGLLGEIAKFASFEGQIHPFAGMAWAKEAAQYFVPEVSLLLLTQEGERRILEGQKEFMEKAILFRSSLEQFALAFLDPQIRVERDQAFVTVKVRGIGRERGRSDYFKEEHKIALDLKKIDGRWRIMRAQNTEPYQGDIP